MHYFIITYDVNEVFLPMCKLHILQDYMSVQSNIFHFLYVEEVSPFLCCFGTVNLKQTHVIHLK